MHKWDDEPNGLVIFTKEEFDRLPDGMEFTAIDGETAIKGKDYIDMDTRFGHLAYGVKDIWNHPQKHLFLIFKLSQ
jgi:hypothetical protein